MRLWRRSSLSDTETIDALVKLVLELEARVDDLEDRVALLAGSSPFARHLDGSISRLPNRP